MRLPALQLKFLVPVATAICLIAGLDAEGQEARGTLAAAGRIPVTHSDLDALVGNRIIRVRAEEYAIRRQILEEHLTARLLELEAGSRKTTIAELIEEQVESRARPATPEEIAATFDGAKGHLGPRGEDEAKQRIADSIRRQRVATRLRQYARDLRSKWGVMILLQPPRFDTTAIHGPARGSTAASVTVVEYGDYQCAYCARAEVVLKRITEEYQGQVRLVFRDFPLSSHQDAFKAAEAARCAEDQGRFWEMHDSLLANQQALKVEDLKRLSLRIVPYPTAFSECLDSGRKADSVRASVAEGASLGINSTPTLIVNGRMTGGARSYEALRELVEDELEYVRAVNGPATPLSPGQDSQSSGSLLPPDHE